MLVPLGRATVRRFGQRWPAWGYPKVIVNYAPQTVARFLHHLPASASDSWPCAAKPYPYPRT